MWRGVSCGLVGGKTEESRGGCVAVDHFASATATRRRHSFDNGTFEQERQPLQELIQPNCGATVGGQYTATVDYNALHFDLNVQNNKRGRLFGELVGSGNCENLLHSESAERSQVSSLSSDIPERVLSGDLPDRKNAFGDDYGGCKENDYDEGLGNKGNFNGSFAEEEDGFPDVNALLDNCECYMNWTVEIGSWRRRKNGSNNKKNEKSEDEIVRLIHHVDGKYITAAEKFEREETLRWYNFEHIAALGALCFWNIELRKFPQARNYVAKAADFINSACFERDLVPKEFLASFDYVWDFLCLYGSLKEWEYTGVMELFPEMNLLSFPPHFPCLEARLKAGVYCIKNYFLEFQRTSRLDLQIDTLRQAISCWPHYYEWYVCLQAALRCQRVKFHEFHHIYPWDAELQAVWTACQLAPLNPKCLLAAIQLLAEIAKAQIMETKWTVIRFGEINFHGIMEVKGYMKEQTEKITKVAPRSVRINTSLSQLFTTVLPYGHRDYRIGRECLERCLKAHPNSCKANHRMAEFCLSVDTNYRRAEKYYELALEANEKSFPSLLAKIQCMLRCPQIRKTELLHLLTEQIALQYWEPKQVATLYFFKGLLQLATEEAKDAVESFITAYVTHERSLAFQELPSLHRKFGWPGWPQSSKLSFANIRTDLLRERSRSDTARRSMIDIILKHLNTADANDRRSQVLKQGWRR